MAISGEAVQEMMAQIVHMPSIMRMLLLFSSRKSRESRHTCLEIETVGQSSACMCHGSLL